MRFIIIGAGMSGILSAIKLQEAGFDYSIYEKADRLGGTWRENEYAGLACDVPSHLYCYSFSPNPDWSHRFSPGAEIQQYFLEVANKFGIDKQIKFSTEITRCEFENGRWQIELSDGSTDVGDFVIAATGVLHVPSYPDIEGLGSFEGETFHSARWNHDFDLKGKRVGVIGTGSTAIQIVGALIEDVEELTLFQRTAQWVSPQENPAFTEEEKADFRDHPEKMTALRADIAKTFAEGFANAVVDANSPELAMIHDVCVNNLESSVQDADLREKLRPDYRAGCKRLIMSEDFYDAIQQPSAHLVTEGIEQIEKAGVRTSDDKLHELDVLILATGFRVDRFMRPMEVIGRNGLALEEAWKDGPFAYMAITIPEFPNLFMLNGPNGPVGNFSLIDVAEMQFGYIMKLVEQVRTGACNEVSVSQPAMERFDAERKEAAKSTIWQSGCNSWYLDANGVPAVWPWTFDRLRDEMDNPRFDDFDLV
ncbi:MAG: NAD(P)/FAD-dependent oxidoreductase [bacterium]|nr:monooxygenase [Deltaproteobacteria bacterium]MCP4908942.1 NAD(P)/FAD-dependent oxidoreductase [bacterium]